MNNELLINEIEYYQFYLSKAIAQVYINEKLCDFHDNLESQFNLFSNSLTEISSALLLSQRMILCDIFIYDRDSKNIYKLLNKLDSTKIVSERAIDIKIKEIAKNLKSVVEMQADNIAFLKKYRNNVFAHWGTGFFENDWRENFPNQYPCDFIAVVELAVKAFDALTQILLLLKWIPIDRAKMTPSDIDELIKKISN